MKYSAAPKPETPLSDIKAPYYQEALLLNEIPLVNIKCQDNVEFMKAMPDSSIKLIVTSPPYNIGKSYEQRSDLSTYLESQAQVIAESVRLLRTDGSICWQVGNRIGRHGELYPLDIILC